jgi:cobalamin biosynthetic protein CobC
MNSHEDDSALVHGGDLGAARLLFPQAREPLIDLSTGINPYPYTLPALPPEVFTRLPEPAALERLTAIAANAYGAPAAAYVIPAPGTQILLPLVAALVPPGRAVILGPTYAEHARVAALVGHRVREMSELGELAEADLAIVTNPNNPDGRLVERDSLLALADELRRHNGLLVIDEAFMDVGPRDASLGGMVERGNIVVLRSFGKFFGLAGLRLGFAIAAPGIATRLKAWLGPWAVSAAAITVAEVALADTKWADDMRARLESHAMRLDELLMATGLRVVGGTALFRLAEAPLATALFCHLGQAGVVVRRFARQPHWLRFGLPPDEAAWARLRAALATHPGGGEG